MTDPFSSLRRFAEDKLTALTALDRRRELRLSERGPDMTVNGLISFTDNDYLGLSQDPRLIEASIRATRDLGTGSGASRLVTGNHPLYAELEARLAELKGSEAAIVFGSGFLANCGVIPALVGARDLVFADSLIHASLHAGIKLSGAKCHLFAHNAVDDLRQALREHRATGQSAMIIVDGVYSMDGDVAPIAELTALAEDYDAWLLVDDAHGFGTLGRGRGTVAAAGMTDRVPLMMGTLSKAVGAYGGYLAAPRAVIDLMKSRARSLVYTTGLPPGTIAAALAALDIIVAEPDRCTRPLAHAVRFCEALGLSTPESCIVPITLGSDRAALDADAALSERGYRVAAFRPPTVPVGTARLRVSFSATHTDTQVDGLIAAIRDLDLVPQPTEKTREAS